MSLIASDNKRVIVGLGATGLSVARYLSSRGLPFAVADSREQPPGLDDFRQAYPDVELQLGAFSDEQFTGASELLVNPGIPLSEPAIAAAAKAGVRISGDIDCFHEAAKAPIVAITGSNGKSTVTTLVGDMADRAGLRVAVGGNLGTPALDLLSDDCELYVLELSSFQLERCQQLGAKVATVLNVSADHLDHHGSMLAYHQAKHRIFQGCKKVVINADDSLTQPLVPENVEKWVFSLGRSDFRRFGLLEQPGQRYLALAREPLMSADELRIAGRHNLSNALAALAIGAAADLPMAAMLDTLREFPGLPHRCEFVDEQNGVRFYNDSKGTNVGASVSAIEGLAEQGRVVLIAGGLAKGGDFAPLAEALRRHGRGAVLIGEAAPQIASAINNQVPTVNADSMSAAVAAARKLAETGDVVLLSPACASFDMFRSYGDRGEQFCEAVREVSHA